MPILQKVDKRGNQVKMPKMPRVWNQRDKKIPADAVYVGRPTRWGNQYKIGDESFGAPMTRQDVVEHFRASVVSPEIRAKIREELRGKDLVCWCAPHSCHADVLLEIANEDASAETGQE